MKVINFFFTLITLLSSTILSAQTSTISDGSWNTGGNWSAGIPGNELANVLDDMTLDVNINIGNGADYIVTGTITDPIGGTAHTFFLGGSANLDVDGNCQFGGNTSIKNNATLTIRNNDTLRVGSNFFVDNLAILTIEPLGVLIVEGSLYLRNSSTSVIDGKVSVGGDLIGKNSAVMSGNGNIEVDGIIDLANSSSVFGNTGSCTPGPCEYGSGAGLPISLLVFSAKDLGAKNILIEWETATEHNNSHFEIEASENGKDFYSIAEVSGAGNSNDRLKYSIIRSINFLEGNKVYLKLSQYDFDNTHTNYNPIVVYMNQSITVNPSAIQKIHIYPNPSNGESINIKSENLQKGVYYMQVLDPLGASIIEKAISLEDGGLETKLDLSEYSLSKGIYILRISNSELDLKSRFILQ